LSEFAPQSILCATDLSPASALALDYAALLARAYGATLHVVHAHFVEMPPYFYGDAEALLLREARAARTRLEQEVRTQAQARAGAEVPLVASVVDAHPVEGLLEAARTQSADLVVMGSHGRTGLSRLLLGSVSEGLLREIDRPLLITRPVAGRESARINRIVCAVDYSELAAQVARVGVSLARRLDADLIALYVGDRDDEAEKEHERLCEWMPEEVKTGCRWEAAVESGPAAERIVHAAARCGADLVVVGGRRRPFLAATVLGATTERVVRHACCPVLTVVADGPSRSKVEVPRA
jgi:nucleotide-binding universal stress UspA family protein